MASARVSARVASARAGRERFEDKLLKGSYPFRAEQGVAGLRSDSTGNFLVRSPEDYVAERMDVNEKRFERLHVQASLGTATLVDAWHCETCAARGSA